jgi:hypothetical protein
MQATALLTSTLQSVPALGAALRGMDKRAFHSPEFSVGFSLNRPDALVPMYQISNQSVAQEAEMAAYVVSNIAERLRRLGMAYGEWDTFDAPAYFDLSVSQTAQLVKLIERVNTVHVVFFADLLLPAFQRAVAAWIQEFAPLYQQRYQEPTIGQRFFQQIQPQMVDDWRYLLTVIQQARAILDDDVGFLATNGAQEERERWRRWWQTAPAAGLDAALMPALSQVPTLTLSFDFPLPASRQPDRLRRLRRNRDRQLAQRNKRRNNL